jgi:hypothetical protein
MKKNYIIMIICFFVFPIQITGCATSKVWETTKGIRNINMYPASSTHISTSNDISRYNPPKFLIDYKSSSIYDHQKTSFPPYSEGYLLIERVDDAHRLYEGLKSLLNGPMEKQITSIDVRIESLTQLRGEKLNRVRVDVNVILPLDQELKNIKISDGRINCVLITKDNYRRYAPDIRDKISEGVGFFLLGGPSGGGPSGNAQIKFIENASMIPIDNSWKPLLGKPNAYKVEISFYEDIETKIFCKSTIERIFLTPFAIILDVATSPLQLIAVLTVPLWQPK